ncbi:MAG: sigma-70 family RNA polymerase sigma factor [Verrucomicrobiales bacterium]|nr:sigma-70 family RNA polymerase sigma factor [Verrucomicrobiales bacterium]
MTDQRLLRDYARECSEAAFAELVRRHVDMVYSTALRLVRDTHLAEDVTQAVFVAMAQNAAQLQDHPVPSGWLHRAARNVAAEAVRSAVRRRAREQEAAAMTEEVADNPEPSWHEVAPQLDEALAGLDDASRDAVLLRYFERKSAGEMGRILGISAEAAQKRVSRAVEQLRGALARRGLVTGAAALTVLLSSKTVQAAPAGLALAVSSAVCLTGSAGASSSGALAGLSSAAPLAAKAAGVAMVRRILVSAAMVTLASVSVYNGLRVRDLRQQLNALETRPSAPNTAAPPSSSGWVPGDAPGGAVVVNDPAHGRLPVGDPGVETLGATSSVMRGSGRFFDQADRLIAQMQGGRSGLLGASGSHSPGAGAGLAGGSVLSAQRVNGHTVVRFRGREIAVGPTQGAVTTRAATVQGREYAAAFDGERVVWENVPGAARFLR